MRVNCFLRDSSCLSTIGQGVLEISDVRKSEVVVDVSQIRNGAYILRIETEKGIINKRYYKQ